MNTTTHRNGSSLALGALATLLAAAYAAFMPISSGWMLLLSVFFGAATAAGSELYWSLERAAAVRWQAEDDAAKMAELNARRPVYR